MLPGIRLIDPSVVGPTFEQLQQVRGFYSFPTDLDVDRYKIGNQIRDTVVAVREVEIDRLPAGQRNWNNDHTVYTHGYGVVAANGNQRAADGAPVFSEKDLPPTGELGDYEPRIYFGESSPDYSIVGGPKGGPAVELDTPEGKNGGDPTLNTYVGKGGVPVGSFGNRLLYATKFRDANLLLSSRVNSDSKILYDRNPRERVEKAAPWLTPDGDPYPAVVDGQVVWIVDGYTTSANYPYSEKVALDDSTRDTTTGRGTIAQQPSEQINYIRNSVKAVVNAYDGSVQLYAWDDKDPLLKTWMKAFPGTVKPKLGHLAGADVAPALPGGHVQGPARPAGEVPRDRLDHLVPEQRPVARAGRPDRGWRRSRLVGGQPAAVLPVAADAGPAGSEVLADLGLRAERGAGEPDRVHGCRCGSLVTGLRAVPDSPIARQRADTWSRTSRQQVPDR